MKNKFFSLCSLLLAVMLAGSVLASCEKDRFDTEGFVLYYSGMTDIGPTMNGVIANPTYKGGVPSDFAIIKVTLDGSECDGSLFSINPENGSINISSTAETKTGVYKISVSCKVDGVTHQFQDAIEVCFLNSVPESVTIDPAAWEISLAAATGMDQETQIPTSVIKTEGEHISITGYTITSVRFNGTLSNESKKLFSISDKGVISLVKSNSFQPGVYTLDIKLNTAASDGESQTGIFENALTVNVISKPLSLTYSPNPARMEEESATNKSTFTSAAPVFVGSLDELAYSIASISPTTDKFSIDAATGVISVKEGHGFKTGESYTIAVKVANKYAAEGVVFENALTLNVIAFITPISNFAYDAVDVIQATAFNITPKSGLQGDEIRFELKEIADADKDIISFDASTGAISAAKGNTLALGEHRFTVRASNDKNEMTATLVMTVGKNPNMFTYFSYGNNLDLSEEQTSGVSQFRAASSNDLLALSLPVKYSDIPQGATVKWAVKVKSQMGGTSIDADGTLHPAGYKASQTGVIFVTATVGEGDAAISVTQPVFFNFDVPITPTDGASDKVTISYTPFAFRVNPRKGGRFAVPTVTATDKVYMDYRRSFNYYNINGCKSDGTPHGDGAPKTAGAMLTNIWDSYFEAIGKTKNYGSKAPMSYFENESNLATAMLYIDNSDASDRLSLVVNPGKWNYDGWADGVYMGQITVSYQSAKVNTGTQIFPIAVWFDKSFNN